MVATLPVIDALHQKTSVTAIALHATSGILLIGNSDGLVQCVDLEGGKNAVLAKIHVNSRIIDVSWCNNKIVILDETNGLHMYSIEAEEIWTANLDAGGAQLRIEKQIFVLDGIGTLRQFTLDGQEYPISQRDVRSFETTSSGLLLMMEDQSVVRTDDDLNVQYSRPQRGEIGEDIVALGPSKGRTWFVAREGHALVPGDEEALEIEIYEDDQLTRREEIKGRVKATISNSSQHYLGLDNGELISMEDGSAEVLHTFAYPIQCMELVDNLVLVGTWFYIYGFDTKTKKLAWQIEHKGMVQSLTTDDKGRMIFFGEDQNDWTGAEPVGVCNLHQASVEVDPSFLQGWFEEDVLEVETNPDVVYRTVDDYTSLLSEEEQKAMKTQQKELDIGFDSLAAAMNEELTSESADHTEQDLDELLQFLHEEAKEIIPPKAYAGENQMITVEENTAVIATLDGTESSDPQDRIVSWSWLDSTGREISTEPKLRVKLSEGMHQFELRVFDIDGGMTSDSVQIEIESLAS